MGEIAGSCVSRRGEVNTATSRHISLYKGKHRVRVGEAKESAVEKVEN